ncbi:MAG: DUF2442 domain-containing protein [Desulfovibrionaceae bacterium]|nr:DUF2442 domain-containing protein [Desulfovibrionaceae bacterium]MBF0512756.1 DUF2442 domain-containing protein [Desulfovibrionaceae bacterium]
MDEHLLIDVVSVQYLDGYRLRLGFDNGVVKVVDLESRLNGEMLEPLRDLELFRQVRVDPEIGTIVWPSGADAAPDTLYEIGETVEAAA